jgi:ATP-dependent helicase/nuclease subunit A
MAESGPLVLPALPRVVRIETVSPSAAYEPAGDRLLATGTERLEVPTGERSEIDPRRRGIALHALLQHLSGIPPDERDAVARRALAELLPEALEAHAALAAKATGILATPEFAPLFGPDSRAEVPFLALGRRRGAPVRIGGRIDRLIVTPGRVLVVDFKSDSVQPASPASVAPGYLTQLGLYALVARELFPRRHVEAAILWTTPESLMNLPASPLLEAVEGFTLA